MPTIVGTASQGGSANQSSGLTVAHDSGATGSRRITIAALLYFDANANAISGVTYGGNAMTAGPVMGAVATGGIRFYYLVNPPTGSNNVVVTTNGVFDELFLQAFSFFDVNQASPFGTSSSQTNNGTSCSATVSLSGSDIAVGSYYGYSGGTATITPTDTQIIETELTAATSGRASQYGDATLQWNIGATADNFCLVAPLTHDGGGAGATIYTRRPFDSPIFTSRVIQ